MQRVVRSLAVLSCMEGSQCSLVIRGYVVSYIRGSGLAILPYHPSRGEYSPMYHRSSRVAESDIMVRRCPAFFRTKSSWSYGRIQPSLI